MPLAVSSFRVSRWQATRITKKHWKLESSTGATCRHCSGPLVVASYLKGTPTMHLMAVACGLVGLLPELADCAIALLRDKLPLLSRESLRRRDLKTLPRDLQDLMLDAPYRYDLEHTDALFAAIDLYRAARPP